MDKQLETPVFHPSARIDASEEEQALVAKVTTRTGQPVLKDLPVIPRARLAGKSRIQRIEILAISGQQKDVLADNGTIDSPPDVWSRLPFK